MGNSHTTGDLHDTRCSHLKSTDSLFSLLAQPRARDSPRAAAVHASQASQLLPPESAATQLRPAERKITRSGARVNTQSMKAPLESNGHVVSESDRTQAKELATCLHYEEPKQGDDAKSRSIWRKKKRMQMEPSNQTLCKTGKHSGTLHGQRNTMKEPNRETNRDQRLTACCAVASVAGVAACLRSSSCDRYNSWSCVLG